jgi:hypothetical protein
METLILITLAYAIIIFLTVVLGKPVFVLHELFFWPSWDGDGGMISKSSLYKVRVFNIYYVKHDYNHFNRHPKNHALYGDFTKKVNKIKSN